MDPNGLEGFLHGADAAATYVVAPVIALEPPQNSPLERWRRAAANARGAYADWCRCRDAGSYAAYRARADQADAAQDALAAL